MALTAAAGERFVLTPALQSISDRALAYLRAGYSVHLRGPAGGGKTTLAFHLASLRNRPLVLLHGDDELTSGDLVGDAVGYSRSRTVDNFVRSVVKTKETFQPEWTANRLTLACRDGATLVYDEITRSRPEAHNALLAVLEERVVPTARRPGSDGVALVHPEFRMICTSNSEEYVGVHRSSDALLDRLVTLFVGYPDPETERAIVEAQSGLAPEPVALIVRLVRDVRERHLSPQVPSLRAGLMIARVAAQSGGRPFPARERFREICVDVLGGGLSSPRTPGAAEDLVSTVDRHLESWWWSEKGGTS